MFRGKVGGCLCSGRVTCKRLVWLFGLMQDCQGWGLHQGFPGRSRPTNEERLAKDLPAKHCNKHPGPYTVFLDCDSSSSTGTTKTTPLRRLAALPKPPTPAAAWTTIHTTTDPKGPSNHKLGTLGAFLGTKNHR